MSQTPQWKLYGSLSDSVGAGRQRDDYDYDDVVCRALLASLRLNTAPSARCDAVVASRDPWRETIRYLGSVELLGFYVPLHT